MKSLNRLLLAGACALLFSACGSQTPTTHDLPTGIRTMTGTLLPAEISTFRRGTHLLETNGQRLCFVESTTINLRSFEGKTVVIRGVFEPNSDPTLLPVLVTQDVTAVEQDSHLLSLPAFGLTGSIPRSWIIATQKDFTVLLVENTSVPLVTITLKKQTPLPTSGAPFLISGHHATREGGSGSQEEATSIERGDDLIVITFTPPKESEDSDLLRAQWSGFLTSLIFTETSSSQASNAASERTAGTPCGGTAGILCPAGEYCAITDMKENIGHCKKI
ncbi:MAG: hypothetical protein PHO20_03160 [Candidatus Peribacteraceae bacterium]|nr:hypothetical protein [Candidatus Peribacteraceae bacterium]MDD5739740.1 hypothetical protein [Candidatus Peribacteraceae bacterium]